MKNILKVNNFEKKKLINTSLPTIMWGLLANAIHWVIVLIPPTITAAKNKIENSIKYNWHFKH